MRLRYLCGVDRDVLGQMAFRPRIASDLREMPAHLFKTETMGLRNDLLSLPLEKRFAFDTSQNRFFANFEGCTVRSLADVQSIRAELERRLRPLGRKVAAIVDYDNFLVLPDVLDAYVDMVREVAGAYYSQVTRYTTSAFVHAKLGSALRERGVTPHIFDSAAEAAAQLSTLSHDK